MAYPTWSTFSLMVSICRKVCDSILPDNLLGGLEDPTVRLSSTTGIAVLNLEAYEGLARHARGSADGLKTTSVATRLQRDAA